MTTDNLEAIEEPPSASGDLVDRVLAVAHLGPAAHVTVIGHHTLPHVLSLMKRDCACVRSLRPGTASPDGEAADLAWIVDVMGDAELDDALRAARRRTGSHGRIVVEGRDCTCSRGFASICDSASAAGLAVIGFDHSASRLVLVPVPAQSAMFDTVSTAATRRVIPN